MSPPTLISCSSSGRFISSEPTISLAFASALSSLIVHFDTGMIKPASSMTQQPGPMRYPSTSSIALESIESDSSRASARAAMPSMCSTTQRLRTVRPSLSGARASGGSLRHKKQQGSSYRLLALAKHAVCVVGVLHHFCHSYAE